MSVCLRVLDFLLEENRNFLLKREFYVITMERLYQNVCVTGGRKNSKFKALRKKLQWMEDFINGPCGRRFNGHECCLDILIDDELFNDFSLCFRYFKCLSCMTFEQV